MLYENNQMFTFDSLKNLIIFKTYFTVQLCMHDIKGICMGVPQRVTP